MKNLLPILLLLLGFLTFDAAAQNEFITTWETTTPGESITIPTFSSATYDYTVDWGDGNTDTNITGDATHTYAIAGIHTVKISGTFPRMYFTFSTTSNDKIKTVEQWGNNLWTSMELAFYLCSNLTIEATDSPDLSNVTSLASMLAGCTNLTGDLSGWDVSNIQNFNNIFSDTENFSQDLTSWTVGNATSMAGMFRNSGFNGSLLGWDVSSVTTFSSIFSNSSFNNSSITGWNTQSVTDLSNAFLGNSVFNQDISGWNTSVVTDFSRMFENAAAFNYDLDLWDVSSATDLSRMFAGATSFNGDISTWKTANVTTLFFMFAGASNYDQPLAYNASTGAWDVSNVTDMGYVFSDATSFNQDIGNWNVSSVTSMNFLFEDAIAFNQDISSWDVANVTQMSSILRGAESFDQSLGSWNISNVTNLFQAFSNAGFSTENYDNTLIGWTDGSFTPPSNIFTFQPSNLTYCAGASARQILDDTYNWNFSGDQQSCTPTAISLTSNSIDENNGIGNQIGELLATDSDVSEDFTFSFTTGSGDTDNSSFTIDKGAISKRSFLQADEVFDYETKSSYSVRIQVEDRDGNTFQQALSITINDVADINPATAFITTWETTTASESITIPTNSGETYNYSIDWGDGNIETGLTGDATHTYSSAGTYTVSIDGGFPHIFFDDQTNFDANADKMVSIDQWGDIEWSSFASAFNGCTNLTYSATDAPDLSNVTSMNRMFRFCSNFNGDLSNWDVSTIENMSAVFENAGQFNGDISTWVVNNATNMASMFRGAVVFNQDISNWVTASNQSMFNMFDNARAFDQDLSGWNVSQVTNMQGVFRDADNFNSDIGGWVTSNVTTMQGMFRQNPAFNQDISDWNTGSVTNMRSMFKDAVFNQDIGSWDISNVNQMDDMLQNSDLSTANYDATLQGWATQTVQNGVVLGALNVSYCNGETARTTLEAKGWDITGDSKDCSSLSDPFITTWLTDDTEITIPTEGTGYNYDITWTNLDNNGIGDGSISGQTGDYTITGLENGDTYQVEISGDFPRIYFNNGGDKDKILTVEQWGDISWTSMERAFSGCSNINVVATDAPDLTNVTSLNGIFQLCSNLTADISAWDVSNITDMSRAFFGADNFNSDISSWDVNNVTTMNSMFNQAEKFNQPIGSWDVQNVQDMNSMFYRAFDFNGNINSWDVENVTSMRRMFTDAGSFNQPLDNWILSSVTDMSEMFMITGFFPSIVPSFNQPLSTWNVSSVENMTSMFENAEAFNQDLSWTTSSVTSMTAMFKGASSFNGDISSWDVSNVQRFDEMFEEADAFNGDISSWQPAGGTNFSRMFYGNGEFNQDISGWDMSSATNTANMFRFSVFNQDIGAWDISSIGSMIGIFSNSALSSENYDQILIAWAPKVNINGVRMDADGINYCDGETARNDLIANHNWTINDGGKQCPNNLPTDIMLSSSAIDESNSIDDLIGTFSTTDVDGTDTHTYSFVAGTGDADNASFNISGSDLEAAEVFDFETKSSYSIRVQTDDGNGGTFEKVFTINVNDVNEAPTAITLSDNTIDENNAVDAVIGSFATSDQDGADTQTYSLVSGAGDSDNGSFSISGENLEAAEVFDFETKSSYSIRVQTDDGKGGTFEESFTITINDVVEKQDQTITFDQLTDKIYGDASFTLTASSDSELEVNFEVVSGPVSLSGNEVTITGTGTATIRATQGGDDTFNPAEPVDQSFDITKAGLTVSADDKIMTYGEALPALTYQIEGFVYSDDENDLSKAVEISTTADQNSNVGTYEITVSGATAANYDLSFEAGTLTIEKAAQEITFGPIADVDIDQSSELNLSATASSSLEVSFEVVSGPATLNGNTLSLTGTGEVTIRANQAGDENFEAAEAVTQSFNVTSSSKADQTITFEDLEAKTFGDADFELTATASSDLAVAYTSSDETVATIEGSTVTIVGAGSTTITASQEGNIDFNPASPISQALVVNKADQEITIESISDKDVEAADFEVVASTTSELELVYAILSGPATINGNLISLTGEIGTVEIEVSQAGNANYNAASATISFDVVDDPCEGFAATASLIQNASCNGEVDGSFEVTTTAGTAPFTFSVGNESQDNGLFENQAAGSYEITVTDANGCTATTTVEITEPDAIEVTAEITDSNSINGNGSITLTVTGGSGNFTYDWSNGAAAASLTDLEIGEYSVIITDEAGCSITESYTIGGVTANSEAFELNIYPNPVINHVEIVHGEKVNQITLIDANGKIISQQKTEGKQTQLEMKILPAGMYFIRLDDGKMKRIIKQ